MISGEGKSLFEKRDFPSPNPTLSPKAFIQTKDIKNIAEYKAMDEQKATAKAARKDGSSWDEEASYDFEMVNEPTQFTGYDTLEDESTVLGVVAVDEVASEITEGEDGIIVTKNTPFYAEMGGQSGDIGIITTKSGAKAEVTYTRKTGDGIYLHEVSVKEGTIKLSDNVTLSVDKSNT